MVPLDRLLQVENREYREHEQRDDLLNCLELGGAEFVGTNSVGRYLEAILKKGNHPTHYDHLKQRHIAIFQVAVPGKGHEYVGEGEQCNGSHGVRRTPFRSFRSRFSFRTLRLQFVSSAG